MIFGIMRASAVDTGSKVLSTRMERMPDASTISTAGDAPTVAFPEQGGGARAAIDHNVMASDISGDA